MSSKNIDTCTLKREGNINWKWKWLDHMVFNYVEVCMWRLHLKISLDYTAVIRGYKGAFGSNVSSSISTAGGMLILSVERQ